MFPIYIPSKGRPDVQPTVALLRASGIPFRIVVEPQDFKAYRKACGVGVEIEQLRDNNKGLAHSRQCIKVMSILSGDRWHWQIDDDVKCFLRRTPGQPSEKISAAVALGEIEAHVKQFVNIGQAGMNQNSWPPGRNAIKVNNLPVQCVLNRNSVAAEYRRKIINDMDYTLQVLDEGYVTLMFDHIRAGTPPIGTNAGGLHNVYTDSAEMLKSMREVCKSFPILSITDTGTGWRLNRNRIFSTYKQRPIPVKRID